MQRKTCVATTEIQGLAGAGPGSLYHSEPGFDYFLVIFGFAATMLTPPQGSVHREPWSAIFGPRQGGGGPLPLPLGGVQKCFLAIFALFFGHKMEVDVERIGFSAAFETTFWTKKVFY